MNILKSVLILFWLSLWCSISAQERKISKEDAALIIKKINENTLNAKNFSAKLNYNIFKSHADSIPYQSEPGFYRRTGSNEHSLLVGIETIQNDNERLVIDTANQNMALFNPNQRPQLIEASMNAALSICEKITVLDIKEYSVLKFYLGEKSNVGFSVLEIAYSDKSFFINKLTLYYLNAIIPGYDNIKNPKVEIVYSNVSTSRIAKSEFSIENYLKKQNNIYSLVQKYRNFTFFNQINTNKNL